LANER